MPWPGQASEHDADHGEADEGGDGARVALEVAREAAVAADPGEAALDDPTLGQDDEAMRVAPLDDIQLPGAGPGDGARQLRPLIAAVGVDALDEGERAAALAQQRDRAVVILDICGMDDDVQEETERVDEDVALAARDLLARVVTLRVERRAPF